MYLTDEITRFIRSLDRIMDEYITNDIPKLCAKTNLIYKSITHNYKTYIAFILVPYLLTPSTMLSGYITTLMGLIYVYGGHVFYHNPLSTVFYFVHTWHHDHADSASIYQEVIMEMVGLATIIMWLTVYYNIGEIQYVYNPYIIIFYCIFYPIAHFFNYTYLATNDNHQQHHRHMNVNFFPDICDIVFNTKYDIKNSTIENTDHLIPTVIVAAVIAYIIKSVYTRSSLTNKHVMGSLGILTYYIALSVITIFSIVNLFAALKNVDDNQQDTNISIRKLYELYTPQSNTSIYSRM